MLFEEVIEMCYLGKTKRVGNFGYRSGTVF